MDNHSLGVERKKKKPEHNASAPLNYHGLSTIAKKLKKAKPKCL